VERERKPQKAFSKWQARALGGERMGGRRGGSTFSFILQSTEGIGSQIRPSRSEGFTGETSILLGNVYVKREEEGEAKNHVLR